jgi:superfamily I DNA and RNA helicase
MKMLKYITPLALVLTLGFTAHAEDTPMEKEMSSMNKAYKALKKSLEDPAQKAENLKLIAEIKKTAEASAKMEPKTTADQPAAGKAAYLEKYKAQMAAFSKEINALEAAVNAGNAAAAKASFDKLNEMKKKGHEDFKKD